MASDMSSIFLVFAVFSFETLNSSIHYLIGLISLSVSIAFSSK